MRPRLDKQLDDGLDDVVSLSVDPDEHGHVPHVEMALVVYELVENAEKEVMRLLD